jgi:hypothetical protein
VTIKEINLNSIYYIKLGRKGVWEEECILHDQTIKLGFHNPLHEECLAGEWEKVHRYWMKQGQSKREASKTKNQIKKFYEGDENALWITFFRRKLYWGFAERDIVKLPDGARIRYIKGGWKSEDTKGEPLTVENLSGKLTKVQGFQGTICDVKEAEYLIKRLNHQKIDIVKKAERTLAILLKDVEALIKHLMWQDFELLVDLIFSRAGWQRVSALGKTQKSIDLVMMSPVTENRAFVQVKSKASKSVFDDYVNQYQAMDQFDEMYFVVHTKSGDFDDWQDTPDIKLWDVEKLSKLVIDSGLISWLIKKVS